MLRHRRLVVLIQGVLSLYGSCISGTSIESLVLESLADRVLLALVVGN
jgi:hypothetical protein